MHRVRGGQPALLRERLRGRDRLFRDQRVHRLRWQRPALLRAGRVQLHHVGPAHLHGRQLQALRRGHAALLRDRLLDGVAHLHGDLDLRGVRRHRPAVLRQQRHVQSDYVASGQQVVKRQPGQPQLLGRRRVGRGGVGVDDRGAGGGQQLGHRQADLAQADHADGARVQATHGGGGELGARLPVPASPDLPVGER